MVVIRRRTDAAVLAHRILSSDPEDAWANYALGLSQHLRDDWELAEATYRKAAKLDTWRILETGKWRIYLPRTLAKYPEESRVLIFDDCDPTTEVLARWIFEEMADRLAKNAKVETSNGASYEIPASLELERVRVWETSSSWGEYVGLE